MKATQARVRLVKNRILTLTLLIILVNLSAFAPAPAPVKDQSIQLALLLDTSNSMDGLIDQAKSQLWKMVNELTLAKNERGVTPHIKIALYDYGNDRLSSKYGYIKQIAPLTADLDLISEKLFGLNTQEVGNTQTIDENLLAEDSISP